MFIQIVFAPLLVAFLPRKFLFTKARNLDVVVVHVGPVVVLFISTCRFLARFWYSNVTRMKNHSKRMASVQLSCDMLLSRTLLGYFRLVYMLISAAETSNEVRVSASEGDVELVL